MDNNTTIMALELATNKLNWYIGLTIASMAISTIAIIISIRYNRKNLENSSNLHKKQLEANHDWNRRSFTTSFLKDVVNELSQTRKKLDELTCPSKQVIKDANGEYINFSTWREANKKLLPSTLHEWVCEEKDENYKRVAKADYDPCITKQEREEIVINILHLINIYEQIAAALKNNVLDKDILLELMKNPIKSNYELWEDYIKHRIEVHHDINLGKSFKWIYEEFNLDGRDAQRKSTS